MSIFAIRDGKTFQCMKQNSVSQGLFVYVLRYLWVDKPIQKGYH
jgi:hypothetical protein